MTTYFDSHVHLADAVFDQDREVVVARARQTGAVGLLCIGDWRSAFRGARELAKRHPGFCFHTAGVHPHDAAEWNPDGAEAIRQEIRHGAVAIGECGLDYHYENAPRHQQRAVFAAQLSLARELGRPVVTHSRDAEDDTREMIVDAARAGVVGVLHSYTGSEELAQAAIEVGWFISFSGIVTFRTWRDDALLRLIPDDRLLVESDAPYLSPVPHRGTRNEPAWVSFTVARVAAARGIEGYLLGQSTAANARRLFRLPPHQATQPARL